MHVYYVYITTNLHKTVLYIGVTNDLKIRLHQHIEDANGARAHFTGKYNAIYLIYFENFGHIQDAIAREKELKGWRRSKKESLINKTNPNWRFLNESLDDLI